VKFRITDLLWLTLYVAMVAAIAGAMYRVRTTVTNVYGSESAQTDWDDWRTAAKDMASGDGPVKRREPRSGEPPALVLMRDHFAACLGLAVLLSSVLFGTFVFFLRGALANPSRPTPLPQGERGESRSPTPSATGNAAKSKATLGPDGVGGLP
jgi:hypothetical protein